MAHSCLKVLSNAKILKVFKKGFTGAIRSVLKSNLQGLPDSTYNDLDRVKQYVFTAGTAFPACKAPSVSTVTLWTPLQRPLAVHHIAAYPCHEVVKISRFRVLWLGSSGYAYDTWDPWYWARSYPYPRRRTSHLLVLQACQIG